MTTRYILFIGDLKQTLIATEIFDRVSCLVFNKRPIKEFDHKKGKLVSYPDYAKFNEFYRAALKRLRMEPEYNGAMPRVVVPCDPTRYQ